VPHPWITSRRINGGDRLLNIKQTHIDHLMQELALGRTVLCPQPALFRHRAGPGSSTDAQFLAVMRSAMRVKRKAHGAAAVRQWAFAPNAKSPCLNNMSPIKPGRRSV